MSQRAIDDVLGDLGAGTPEAPVSLGRYDIVGRLGRGGMGTVYEAIDRERGTKVALKTLSAADAAAHVGLKREFRVVADLTHPNLAPVYELASERGVWFFTMERIEGLSLSRWARAEPEDSVASHLPLSRTVQSPGQERTQRSPGVESARVVVTREEIESSPFDQSTRKIPVARKIPAEALPPGAAPPSAASMPVASPPTRSMAELRRAFAEIVGGVAALHAAGLRHGDIKPANVLVRAAQGGEAGRVALVDFGLVRPVRERREPRTPSGGTPTFMAPEQFGEGEVGPEADWYAVGATMYRVLTGLLPFEGSSLLDLYIKKTVSPPPSPHELLPQIPADLSDVCMRLMGSDPKLRPSERALLELLAGDEPAPETAPSARSARTKRSLFVGRDAELSALEQAYGAARAGTPTLVHTHGPSGIGKSSLLTSFLSAVQDVDSALVLRGRCYERESVPYKGFDRIVDEIADLLLHLKSAEVETMLPEWSGELGRAFPALASVPAIADRAGGKHVAHDAIELRRRAWIALGELLAALRRRGPVVLAIDDLQWADEDSARLLEALLRGPDRPALLVVILFRPEEARENRALRGYFELCASLEAEGRLVDLPIGALSDEEAEELARGALRAAGAPDTDSRARFLAREARGVPFFIEELAYYLRSRDESDGDVSVETAIRARVDALPADQRALVELSAVGASPLPQSVLFEAAGLAQGSLSALLALRSTSLVSWLGAGADDVVSIYHDRIRESVTRSLDERGRLERHLAIGRALAKRASAPSAHESRGWVFDAVRHLGAAAALVDDPVERLEIAKLHAEAGERARRAAAFPLAFRCFEGGISLLAEDAWSRDYATTLRLHAGSTESAYLTASWDMLDRRIADMKEHALTVMDELVAWEAQIDAHVGRHEYLAAIAAAGEVLALLGVRFNTDPSMDELGAAIKATLGRLTSFGSQGLLTKPDLTDPVVLAANRIQVRVSPAAYFGKPTLLPLIACNLVTTSIDRGVSPATPYALALFGIVLNTIDLYQVSHEWGELALRLLERWPDRRLEAATRHILRNLVCCWMVPLSTVLEPLREVFDIGCQTGDYEYASYAAHGYVHNAMYAGRPLAPLLDEALDLGKQMRALGQVNAVHVHAPFEQLLKAFNGKLADPAKLDGDGFSEAEALAAAEAEGSRSGIYVLSIAMGLARWHFGAASDASACFERARSYLDAAPSVWHQPIMHQFGALSACRAWDTAAPARRDALREHATKSLAALRKLATYCTVNFAHRVNLVEAELARIGGDHAAALKKLDQAIRKAQEGGWVNDVALANELAARVEPDAEGAKRRLRAARTGYVAWGASAKAERATAALAGR